MRASAMSEIVTTRIRGGVSQLNDLAASHARIPVAPAAAVAAPITHCVHMGAS